MGGFSNDLHIISAFLSLFFRPNTSIINILVCLMVSPQVSESVTFILFYNLRQDTFNWYIFKCSDYSPSSNITEPSTNIFKYCTFQLQNSYLILVGLRPKLKDAYMLEVTITGLPSYLYLIRKWLYLYFLLSKFNFIFL